MDIVKLPVIAAGGIADGRGLAAAFALGAEGVIGLVEGSQFTSQALQLETDDVLVMYTDGMTEAESPGGESWGQERLKIVLRDCRHCSPAQILTRIVDGVSAFTEGAAQSDDRTLVVVGVKHPAGV